MFSIGDLLDQRYQITGELGQGGMSYVFRARDQHLERDVALKILRPHLTDTDQERFLREIKTLARLSHPGVVAIHDLGRSDFVYFAMELVEGGLFTDLGPLEPDPEPFERLLSAAVTVAETLAYVHRLGIVHRDITPRNILLTNHGFPKVMDFGLVQLAETTRQLTRTGLTLGTPHYMAPEQARGGATGAHTDLYAFGAVLYRAVTGVTPFDADNDQAVLYQHVYGEPTPANERNPAAPQALSDLIGRLLAKTPGARPSTGEAVADALRSIRAAGLASSAHHRLGGPAQQGNQPYGPVDPQKLKPVWRLSLGAGPQWPAALTAAEGFVFVGLRSEEILVLRPADGSLEARIAAPDEVNTAPLFHGGDLAVVSRDGSLSLLSWPAGTERWSAANQAIGVSPYGRNFITSTRTGRLEARSPYGEVLWTYEAGEPFLTPPLVHRGQAFAVTQDGWVHAADAGSGQPRFKLELGSVAATPAAKDGLLLLPERSGELHAFDTAAREVRWTYDLGGQLWASPVCWQSHVYACAWSDAVRCLSLQTGDDVWAHPVSARITATPVVAAGVLYLVTEAGDLLALDARTGTPLFEENVALSPIQTSPLVLGNTVIVAALDGTVKAYRSDS
jgi:eukaryotic-like serine/threonine-protein kinase